jgi:DNA-binding NarL/FixJ family response regulator
MRPSRATRTSTSRSPSSSPKAANVYACRFALQALYGHGEGALIEGIRPINPLNVLDIVLLHRKHGAPSSSTPGRCKTMVRVAAAQIAPDLDSADGALARVLETMRDAARRGVELIVFPETFVPYYPYLHFVLPPVQQGAPHLLLMDRAPTVPGPVTDAVSAAAREHGMVVVMGDAGRAPIVKSDDCLESESDAIIGPPHPRELPMPPITVALVEDDAHTRERIVRVIEAEPTLTLGIAAATAGELLDWLAEHPAHVILVDLGLPDRSGLEVIARCDRMQPACSVMVLTMFGDEENMLRSFEAGARGYLLKDGTEEDLATHIRALHAGGSPMSPLIARQLLARWQGTQRPSAPRMPSAPQSTVEPLSPRETQVLDLIARGFTYSEIAGQLLVSVTTVQTHVRNIYGKLGVHSKTEAVFEARHVGLLR